MAPVVTGAARAIGGDVGDIVGGLVHTAMIPGEVWQHGQPGSPEGEEQAREFAMTFGLGGGAAPEGALGMGAVRRARSAGEAATAGAPPAAAPLAAPMIGRGTEAPMFDYSRLAEQPDVPQFDLPRAPPPPKGIPERVQAVADPANLARVNAAVQRGVELGGPEWYGTQPLRDRFIGELGEAEGPAAYQRYLDYVAATSNASKVPENIRNASYYYTLERQGLPPPELVPSPTSPGNVTLAEPLPSPYGHFAQISHARNVRDVLSEGGWNVLQNPKPPSFVQNLAGNWQPLTIDRHNVRLLGLTGDVPPAGTYGYLEDLQRGEAARMGLAPAQYQASSWLGAGQETGLASPVEPFLQTVENRIRLTAKARGETPEVTLGRWIRGEAPLLSIPAAAVGTTLAAELAGVDQPLRD
jgi:hypothetical protein